MRNNVVGSQLTPGEHFLIGAHREVIITPRGEDFIDRIFRGSSGLRRTLSRITYQRFFKKYILLSGMTGTAKEISSELKSVYDLEVLKIPPHKPSRRQRLPNQCWVNSDERWAAVTQRSIELSHQRRAVLIGTRSVEASEHLAKLFAEKGLEHSVLNARQDKEEADIVVRAGESGRITIATNMAGRGTDIKLDDGVRKNGGLHVILTEIHESARIDRQLFGRSAVKTTQADDTSVLA